MPRHTILSGPAHPRGNAKLTPEDVRNIRELLTAGITSAEIARKFEVCPAVIRGIKLGRTYRGIGEASNAY